MIALYVIRPKKLVLFPEIGRVKFFFYSSASIVECVSEYISLISKKRRKENICGKSNKMQWRHLPIRSVLLTYLIETEFLLVFPMNFYCSWCATREITLFATLQHHVKYTLSRTKIKSLRDIFVYQKASVYS